MFVSRRIHSCISANSFVYLHALFEAACAFNFAFDPGALHNGLKPDAGFATYSCECFAIACLFWAILLVLKANDAQVLFLDSAFNVAWLLYLGPILAGTPLHQASALPDGSWALVPVVAHGLFAVTSFLAAMAAPKVKTA